ncbi:iron complex outermembrane recepter protein [Sphingomonas sp. YR710]|nr:iron complex outermembrane recepter protein [Sphingomonas sp. YR710]
MRKMVRPRHFGMVSGLALAFASFPAAAQTDPAPAPTPVDAAQVASTPASAEPEATEIIVTAQKRSERLVQVPLAVTAISGSALAGQQINDTSSLTRAVPSLSFQAGNNPGNASFRIRGVGTQLFSLGVESAVSVVVDGVVAPRQAQGFSDLADLERVEVLRGPQGTLFGKNATAGVISIVTQRPGKEFGGSVEATVAEQGEYRVNGTVTTPISETLRARVSGFYNDVGGHIYNVAKNKDVNGYKSWGVRGKLAWDATPDLTFLLTGDYREMDADGNSRVPVRVTTAGIATLLGPDVIASPSNRNVSNDDLSYYRTKSTIVSLQGDWDLGAATITSISAFQRYIEADQFEPDQIASDPLRFVGTFPYAQWNQNSSRFAYNNYSEELRIGSNGNRDFTYVAGIFYAHLDLDRAGVRRRLNCSAGAAIGGACTGTVTATSSGYSGNFTSDNVAAFGQIDWRLVGGLHLIAGLREQHEKQTVTGSVFGPLVAGDTLFPGTPINSGTRSRSGSATTGKAGLRYEFNRNLQVYASYTRGYKAFALDIDITDYANQTGIAPEHVNAYELGAKWQAPGGVFDISTALFRSDFQNLQIQSLLTNVATGTFVTVLGNAGKSRSQGFEVEATARPSRNFSVAANFTLIDATVDVPGQSCPIQLQTGVTAYSSNFPVNQCYARTTTVGGVTTTSSPIIDVVGGQLPATPRYRVGVTPRYERAFGNLSGFVQVALNYQSDTIFALNQDPLLKQDGYAIVDASIGLRQIDSRWNVTLFVRNLFNHTYYSQLNHGTILANATNGTDLWANINKDANRYFGTTFGVKF